MGGGGGGDLRLDLGMFLHGNWVFVVGQRVVFRVEGIGS